MDFKVNDRQDVLFVGNNEKTASAYILFPKVKEGLHVIEKVYVDEIYRGQGVAGKLMQALVDYAEKNDIKLEASCSYAVSWLEKNK